jgi:dihydropteridine reductase
MRPCLPIRPPPPPPPTPLSLSPGRRLSTIVVTAGGWAGTGVSGEGGAVAAGWADMIAKCLLPPTAAAHTAVKWMPRGHLVVLGSAAALKPTPTMLAYGTAKAATHHFVRSLGAAGGDCGPHTGRVAWVVAPHTIDTPSNRKWVKGDTSSWTPMAHLVEGVLARTRTDDSASGGAGAAEGVPTGSVVEVVTEAGRTSWRVV